MSVSWEDLVSARKQSAMVWWSIAWAVVYGITLIFLFHMVPPPSATMSSGQIIHWYLRHHTDIEIGAALASVTSAWPIPLVIVIGLQMSRHERGRKVWSILAVCGGVMMSLLILLPQICWGVAAFAVKHDPQVTVTMHDLGMLCMVTTDQYYIFLWVAMIAICLTYSTVKHSPFPRWFAYFNGCEVIMFTLSPIAFLTHRGPFAWSGLISFWCPLVLFGVWLNIMCVLLLKSLKAQREEQAEEPLALRPETAAAAPVGV